MHARLVSFIAIIVSARNSRLSGARAPYQGQLGVIAEGALADLLVIDGEPEQSLDWLGDPGNLRLVMKNGRLFKNELSGDSI